MKKLLVILMVVMLALSLVACGGGATASAAPAAPAPASSAPASGAASVASTPAESTAVDTAAVGDEWGLTEAYMGVSSNNEAVCIGFNEDWSLGVFVAMGENGEYVSFVGPATDNEDGTATITDETNELALIFGVTELESGNLELDLGELGTAEVAACEVSEVVKTMQMIDEGGTAVA